MLADARHDEPMPPEVAARLEETLVGLRAEQATDAEPADRDITVVPLRRRPRRLPRYLLAAAAVAAIGYGTTEMVGNNPASDDGSSAGSDSRPEDADQGAASGEEPSATNDAPPPESFVPLDELGITGLEPIRPGKLGQDLSDLEETEATYAQRSTRRLARNCGPQEPTPGSRTLAAAYAGRPALVVYLPAEGETQRVDLYLCDTAEPRSSFRSVTLPARE